jgi:hypothetical protein
MAMVLLEIELYDAVTALEESYAIEFSLAGFACSGLPDNGGIAECPVCARSYQAAVGHLRQSYDVLSVRKLVWSR